MVKQDWQTFGTLHLKTGQLGVADPMFLFDDPVVVALAPGEYTAQVQLLDDGGHLRVVAARIARIVAREPSPGAELGRVGVDFGQVALFDLGLGEGAFARYNQDRGDTFLKALEGARPFGLIPYGAGEELLITVTDSGWGDGSYFVRELVGETDRVGVEIRYIDVGERSPFRPGGQYDALP